MNYLILAALSVGQVLDKNNELNVHNPDSHVRMANLYLDKIVPKEYRHKTRFISFLGTPTEHLEKRLNTLNFWLNQLTFEPYPTLLKEVPKTQGRLFAFYLDDYGWNAASWNAAVQSQPYISEPFVFIDAAIELREKLCLEQNKVTFHMEGVVRADLLFRDSIDLRRSKAYHDLLYSKHRFVPQKRTQQIYHAGGDYQYLDGRIVKNVPKGTYEVEIDDYIFKKVDFPKTEADVEKIFGIDVTQKYLKEVKIDPRHGAVIEEGLSIVSNNNRLLQSLQIPFGRFWKTFDVGETAGKKDFSEQLYFDFQSDAHEMIYPLPNGGQAYELSDANFKLIAAADNEFVKDIHNPRLGFKIVNPGSCVYCHERGIIPPPSDFIKDLQRRGIKIKDIYNPKKERDIKGFFLDWEYRLKEDQERYIRYVKKTSGYTPDDNAKYFLEWREWYDSPVTTEQAALEWGLTINQFKSIAARSPNVRLLQLLQDQPIPRTVWEKGVYREFGLLLRTNK